MRWIEQKPLTAGLGVDLPSNASAARCGNRVALRFKSRRVLADQGPDHSDQLSRFIGFAEEEPALRNIVVSNARVAGCQHKLDRWPAATNGLGKRQTVHASWHIDVREDDPDVLSGFEQRDGLVCAGSL